MIKLFFLLFLINIFRPDNNINSVEVHFRNGEVNLYDDAGRSSPYNNGLTPNLKVKWDKHFFWLHFNKCSSIELRNFNRETITANITLSDGSIKEFEIFYDDLSFRNKDRIEKFPLAQIEKIIFSN